MLRKYVILLGGVYSKTTFPETFTNDSSTFFWKPEILEQTIAFCVVSILKELYFVFSIRTSITFWPHLKSQSLLHLKIAMDQGKFI